MKMPLYYVCFCAGWGGGSLGFHQAGWKCRGSYDNNANAIANYELNFPGVPVYSDDLMTITGEQMRKQIGKGKIHCIFVTAPCTGVSLAGKFDPYHPLNSLLIRCIRLAVHLNPDTILVENVPGLTMGEMQVLYWMVKREMLAAKNYIWKDDVISCLHHHAPQDRDRWFALGVHKRLKTVPSFPTPDKSFAENLRIRDIDPSIISVDTGYKHQSMRTRDEYMYTITKTRNVWRQDGKFLSSEQVLKFCGYPDTWQTVGSDTEIWNRAGNSVMPPTAEMFARHIYDLLTKHRGSARG